MLRQTFFYNFFKNRRDNNKIVKYNTNNKFDLEIQIKNKIIEIDEKISENSKDLLEAQIVKIRSNFSQSTNFIEKIGKNVYNKKVDQSITWHQIQLKELYFQRKKLQLNLEKIKGIFWLNQIKRFLKIILIVFLLLLILFIFLSGFIMIIYFLPLIIVVFLGYLLCRKRY